MRALGDICLVFLNTNELFTSIKVCTDAHMNRRESMFRIGTSLGSVAFASLIADELKAAEASGPLAPRPVHVPAKAKNCIFLTMTAGLHIDTFDPKQS